MCGMRKTYIARVTLAAVSIAAMFGCAPTQKSEIREASNAPTASPAPLQVMPYEQSIPRSKVQMPDPIELGPPEQLVVGDIVEPRAIPTSWR